MDIIKKNIENEKGNRTRFLVMGNTITQTEISNQKYITSFLFKLNHGYTEEWITHVSCPFEQIKTLFSRFLYQFKDKILISFPSP